MKKPFHIVLDIDSTLAYLCDIDLCQEFYFPDYFTDPNHYLTLPEGDIYFLFRGVLEFIQYLFENPNIRVSFFSNGSKNRNKSFVEALLIKALGDEHYQEIKYKVIIISSLDAQRINTKNNEEINDFKNYLEFYKNIDVFHRLRNQKRVKNGKNPLRPDMLLNNTIIIDDNFDCILEKHKKHWLPSSVDQYADKTYASLFKHSNDYFMKFATLTIPTNNIFYLTGVLVAALETLDPYTNEYADYVQTKTATLPEGSLTSSLNALPQEPFNYLTRGIEKLKTYNENLELVLPSTIKQEEDTISNCNTI